MHLHKTTEEKKKNILKENFDKILQLANGGMCSIYTIEFFLNEI
jgi:hypothetical protein